MQTTSTPIKILTKHNTSLHVSKKPNPDLMPMKEATSVIYFDEHLYMVGLH